MPRDARADGDDSLIDFHDLHALPRVVLGSADLDLLELALGGALEGGVQLTAESGSGEAPRVVLSDTENTPLAVLERGSVHALRPRATGQGIAFDPALRRTAHDVRGALHDAGEGAIAVVFTELPTILDLERAGGFASLAPSMRVLWAAVVRGADDGLVRAVMDAKPADAIPLVVPAADLRGSGDAGSGDLGSVGVGSGDFGSGLLQPAHATSIVHILQAYGASRVLDVEAARDSDEAARIHTLAIDESHTLFPPASARERVRSRRVATRAPGAVVLLTGLSGSGKSTVARALAERLESEVTQPVTLLDGDEIRQALSHELGFDRRSRELHLLRIGYVASLLSRAGGIAIAAPIAPFDASREEIRGRVESHAVFLLVHVATPIEVCEARDRKGLYALARSGALDDFTGVSSPYEVPGDADVTIDTSTMTVSECVDAIATALGARLVAAAS